MAVKIPGVEQIISKGVGTPISKVINAAPGFVTTSNNPQEFANNIKASLRLAEGDAKADLKEFGLKSALDSVSAIDPRLGKLAGKLLRRGSGTEFTPEPDPPLNPNSWYAKGRQRLDPLMSYTWDVAFPELDGLTLPSSMVEEVQFTLPANQDWNMFRNGTYSYYAGVMDVGQVSMLLYEDVRMSSSTYIEKWRKRVQNTDGTFNSPSFYKNKLLIFLQDNEYKTIATVQVSGAFPLTRDGFILNSSSSDRSIINVQFSVTDMTITFNETSPIVQSGRSAPGPSATGSNSWGSALLDAAVGDTRSIQSKIMQTKVGTSVMDGMKKTAGIVKSHLPGTVRAS